jgi:hypothetical protein
MTTLKLIGLLAVDVSGFGIVMSADSQRVELLDGENRVLAGVPRIRNPILIRDGGGFRGLIGYVGTEAIDRPSMSEWLSAFGAFRAPSPNMRTPSRVIGTHRPTMGSRSRVGH